MTDANPAPEQFAMLSSQELLLRSARVNRKRLRYPSKGGVEAAGGKDGRFTSSARPSVVAHIGARMLTRLNGLAFLIGAVACALTLFEAGHEIIAIWGASALLAWMLIAGASQLREAEDKRSDEHPSYADKTDKAITSGNAVGRQ